MVIGGSAPSDCPDKPNSHVRPSDLSSHPVNVNREWEGRVAAYPLTGLEGRHRAGSRQHIERAVRECWEQQQRRRNL